MREQLTESDVKKIQEEIDHRKLVVRKEAIEAVKEAREQEETAHFIRSAERVIVNSFDADSRTEFLCRADDLVKLVYKVFVHPAHKCAKPLQFSVYTI